MSHPRANPPGASGASRRTTTAAGPSAARRVPVPLPAVVFAGPNRLPDPSVLGASVAVLDISFALPVVPPEFPLRDVRTQRWLQKQFEDTTLSFITTLGSRLRLWVDHHDHAGWPLFQEDARFLLVPAAQAPACALLVDEDLLARLEVDRVDTLVCHGDADGVLSAARFLRGGAWPYADGESDAIAADTRRGVLSQTGTTLDRALKARSDDAIRHAALRWLVAGDTGGLSEVQEAAADYARRAADLRRLAANYRDVGSCRIVDIRDAERPCDLTALLQELQGDDRVGVVIHPRGTGNELAVGCRAPGVHLPRLLGLGGGSPGRVALAEGHLGELIDAVGPTGERCRPRQALVEIVRRCNLRCPLCPVGNSLARRLPDMSGDTFRRIVDRVASSLESMTLHNYGEPLLHPQAGAFIRYAKEAGIGRVALTTNGNQLPLSLAEDLIESGLDSIRFSVDTADADAYRRYRVGGDLSRVLANIRLLADARARRGAAGPAIEAQAMLMRTTEAHTDTFERVLLGAGADRVRWKTFNPLMSGEDLLGRGTAFVPLTPAYRRQEDLAPRPAATRAEMRLCRWPWDRLVVLADGTVTPCCHDYNGEFPLGSGADESGALWDTAARRAFMVRRILYPESIAMCRRCPSGVPRLGLRREAVPGGGVDES